MVNYVCPKCNKVFNRKSTYVDHTENKKKPCDKSDLSVPPISSSSNVLTNSYNFMDILVKEPVPNNNNCVCMYCDKIFTRIDNLQRHLNGRCKSKENYNELEKLKDDIKLVIDNYKNLQNNYSKVENKNNESYGQLVQKNELGQPHTFDTHIINNNNNNQQINKGVILNTTNIQIVQFGEEDIDKINLNDAMKMYLKSTGGNIASNMLAYLNMNEQYPENNNICITDNSREIVKMHNGKKFVYKKFKNVKNDILDKVLKNTRKIVNKFEDDKNIKRSQDVKTKLKINDVSLKLIDGVDGEEIVRDEIKEKEQQLKLMNDIDNTKNTDNDSGIESDEERDFTFEERLRVEHLNNKRQGLQIKTFENLKEELYNGRELLTKNI
jgi:hypothetical protein